MATENERRIEQVEEELLQEELVNEEVIADASLEEIEEAATALRNETLTENVIDTQHTDGSTTNPVLAQKQGLVYTPPHDPPTLPGGLQGAEIAAGFATSMEEANLDVERLPARIDDNDLDLEENIETALRNNSETANLEDVRVHVSDKVAYLYGFVDTDDDIEIVHYMVRDIPNVADVQTLLRVKDL